LIPAPVSVARSRELENHIRAIPSDFLETGIYLQAIDVRSREIAVDIQETGTDMMEMPSSKIQIQ
jgi:hypothetical protein